MLTLSRNAQRSLPNSFRWVTVTLAVAVAILGLYFAAQSDAQKLEANLDSAKAEVPMEERLHGRRSEEPARPFGGGIEAYEVVITSESCAADQVASAGELVTVSLGLKNSGGPVANVVGTLSSFDAINISSAQSYGAIPADNQTIVYRTFSFMVNPEDFGFCGGDVFLYLQLNDGPTDLGLVFFQVPRGTPSGAPNSYTTGNITAPIADSGTTNIPIIVPDSGTVSDINVRLRLNHTMDSQLAVRLVSPSGFEVPLVTNRGGSGDNFGSGANSCAGIPTVFDTNAATSISQGAAPFVGTFRPESSSLNDLRGFPANGTWNLRIIDNAASETGTVGCVTLEINRSELACCESIINVGNTADSGAGSLRQAIITSNSQPGADIINFNIPGAGVHTITLGPTAFPLITDPVFINGASQPGYTSTPLIEINGINTPPNVSRGLDITAGHSRVRALAINRFPAGAIALRTVGRNRVWDNFLGTNPAGTAASPNGTGLFIADGSSNNIVGECGRPNLISGNAFQGILINSPADQNSVGGNLIGTDLTGTTGIPNGSNGGILLSSSRNYIGQFDGCNSGNTIAFNAGPGINIVGSGTLNAVYNNAIFSNGGLGIDLGQNGVTFNDPNDSDVGPNNLQNYPVITSVAPGAPNTLTVQGSLNSLANSQFRVDLFSSQSCDPTGNGEGQTKIGEGGVFTAPSGNGTFSATVPAPPPGSWITAIAAVGFSSGGETSEFSQCFGPGRIRLSAPSYNVNEVDAGASNFNVPVFRDLGNLGAVNVGYTLGGAGDAVGGTACGPSVDYINTGGTVGFAAGSSNSAITVPICGDTASESAKTFSINLFSPSGNAILGSPNAATVTIIDNDAGPVGVLQFSSPTVTFAENSGTANLTVTRTGSTAGIASVQFTTPPSSGTAVSGASCVPGVDYITQSGTITFPNGSASQPIGITLCDDFVYEFTETFDVALSNAVGATVGSPQTATVLINNDDTLAFVIRNPGPEAPEGNVGNTNLTFTIDKIGQSAEGATVCYQTVDGTATAGMDFTPITGTNICSNFSAASSSVNVSVAVIGDTTPENDETFSLRLISATQGVFPAPGTDDRVATINDDDGNDSCLPRPIGYGQTLDEELDGPCFVEGGPTDVYSFNGTQGQQVVINMSSDDFPTRLRLLGPANNEIASAAATASSPDSRLPATDAVTLPITGVYTIRAFSTGVPREERPDGFGRYALNLALRPAGGCTYAFAPRTDVPFTGGEYSFYVVSRIGCPQADTPPVNGSFYRDLTYRGGLISFRVLPNTQPTDRSENIVVAGQNHVLNQYGTRRPPNDDFGSAEPISGVSSRGEIPIRQTVPRPDAPISGFNSNATAQAGEPAHAGLAATSSVWYIWSTPAGQEGLYSFTTSGSSFDTVLSVYACPVTGSCSFSNIQAVSSNNDTTEFDLTSKVNFKAGAGRTYMIAVDGNDGATGTINLTWRKYLRLYRLYLQNGSGAPSSFEPTSVRAVNPNNVDIQFAGSKLTRGVYEFSLPRDGVTYNAQIAGPQDIDWNPNNFALRDDLTGPSRLGQNSVSIAQCSEFSPCLLKEFIQSINQSEVGGLSVFIGALARNPPPASPCVVNTTTQQFEGVSYAQYTCVVLPETNHTLLPKRTGKRFTQRLHRFKQYFNNSETAVLGSSQPRFVAQNESTFNIVGQALGGGSGANVSLFFGLSVGGDQVDVRVPQRATDTGGFSYTDLFPGVYNLKASKPGFKFTDPPAVNLASTQTVTANINGAPCGFTLTPPGVIAAGGEQEVPLGVAPTPGDCEWFITSDVDWITVNSGAIVGEQNAFLNISANNTGAPRQGTLRLTGRAEPIEIQQAGPSGSNREVRINNAIAVSGQPVAVTVDLESLGNESGLSFSINYNPAAFSFVSAAAGTGVPGGTVLSMNATQIAQGRLGVLLDSAGSYTAGTRRILTLTLMPAPSLPFGTYPVTFSSSPTVQSISSLSGVILTATYLPGNIVGPNQPADYEGDLVDGQGGAAGDGLVLANDVAKIRQFILGGAVPATNSNQFQRSDVNLNAATQLPCGNGVIDAGDVTVIRNMILGSVPSNSPSCGPLSQSPIADPALVETVSGRELRVLARRFVDNRILEVAIELESSGNEASMSFTLDFDQRSYAFSSAAIGSGAPDGTVLSLNSSDLAAGRLGILLDSAATYQAGRRRVITVVFEPTGPAPAPNVRFNLSSSLIPLHISSGKGHLLKVRTAASPRIVDSPTVAVNSDPQIRAIGSSMRYRFTPIRPN